MGKMYHNIQITVESASDSEDEARATTSNEKPVKVISGPDVNMADQKRFGYEQTLIYGRYTKDLGSFAKFQAKASKSQDKTDFGSAEPRKRNRLWQCYGYLIKVRDWVLEKVGEDWIFLALLGIIMALLSFIMDFVIEKMQEAKFWLYEELSFSVALQYICWVLYSVLLIMFATGFTHLVSPQAIGSGIPEMKTILRGVVLKEFLTFKTLISKIVGLCSSLGSTLPFGKEGPFVHIASIVANLLSKIGSFKGIYENESRRSEMLAAACAVGVAGTFAAPIGGVLFSIEVTATYFAVRNYWRGFFGAVCGAVMFRLLAFWFKYEETLTALFKTNLKTDFPFDPLELLAFSFIGLMCGFGGALFILLHRRIILFTRKHKRMSAFLQKNRFIYPGLVALVISSLTFPPGLGQFYAGTLTHRRAVDELFSNITWTKGQADDLDDEEILSHWNPPETNIYVTLVLFIVMNLVLSCRYEVFEEKQRYITWTKGQADDLDDEELLSHWNPPETNIYVTLVLFIVVKPRICSFRYEVFEEKQRYITWTKCQADDLDDEEILSHWNPPETNIYVTLVLFIVMNFWMGAICNTLPIPAGVFVPVFTVGAAFGRLIGEGMAAWFPNGVKSGDVIHKIVPGGYAVVGAASLSGSVTRTISTSVIVFELTGQISHVLPAVIAVLISNAVANVFQPSFYDSIIRLKRLPYLPNIVSSKVDSWNVYVEDIMIKDVKYVSFVSTFHELKELLENSAFRTYPLVDSKDSMILLGSVKRFELERMLWVHLSEDQKIFMPQDEDEGVNSAMSTPGSSRAPSPLPQVQIIPDPPSAKKPRFQVTKVTETETPKKKPVVPILTRSSSTSSVEDANNLSIQTRERQTYHTLDLPLRSILKNSPQSTLNAKQMDRSASLSDIQGNINRYYRRKSEQLIDSIVEDKPFTLTKDSIQSFTKHVKLPPEPVKVKNLSPDKHEAWEQDQLSKKLDWDGCQIDPAPFQLVERTSLHKVHSLFSLLGLNHAYVTNTGRLHGVVALKELRHAIQGHIDAEAELKKAREQAEDSDSDIEDPQHLVVEHPKLPDGYTLVNRQNSRQSNNFDESLEDTSRL